MALLADRKDDDEFVLQILVTLQALFAYAPTLEATLGDTEASISRLLLKLP